MANVDSRAGVGYLTAEIIEYIERVHAPQDASLRRALDTPESAGIPAIQVGASEGKLLALILKMIQARKVVEIGTLVGYSAIHLARALPEDGHLWTLEFSAKHAALARQNIENAQLQSKVTVLEGAALDTLPTIEAQGPFDAVFIDADKGTPYVRYGRWAASHLRRGGIMLADNSFFFGRLTADAETATPLEVRGTTIVKELVASGAAAMRRFHEDASKAFDTVCIPTPDGLLLGIKK
jgi:caffeoyl-CoA O-methyltransferase